MIISESIPLKVVNGNRTFAANPLMYQKLFGDLSGSSENQYQPSTFVFLEAARYFGLPEVLEGEGVEFDCLFSGAARTELVDVAPYIVHIGERDALTQKLLKGTNATDPPWMMCRKGGVFLRSAMQTDALVRQFRRFTRLFDRNTSRWNYFRFFAPETMLKTVAQMDDAAFENFSAGVDMFLVPDGNAR